MQKSKISEALLEVWKWKEQAAREVQRLPIQKALQKRMHDSLITAQKLGFSLNKKYKAKTPIYFSSRGNQ